MGKLGGTNARLECPAALFSAIRNPGTFYFAGDWTAPRNDALWGDGGKTLFDPCPVGWQVPQSGDGNLSPWWHFEDGNGQYANGLWRADLYGGTWDAAVVEGASSVWYPASGWRHYISGIFGNVQFEITVWSSSAGGFLRGRANLLNANFYSGRAHGFPVRCIRE